MSVYSDNVTLYVCGALSDLEDLGLVEIGPERLPPGMLASYDQLRASGFRPKKRDVLDLVDVLGKRPLGSSSKVPRPRLKGPHLRGADEKICGLIVRLDKIKAELETA